MKKAEMIFSANYIGFDEDTGDLDGERILDRIAVIPFAEWDDMPAGEFAAKQKKFKEVVDCPKKPTEFLIGECGYFIRSEEFHKKREEFTTYLHEKSEECIKIRTLSTNYSSFYTLLWKFHEVFQDLWEEMDASLAGILAWVDNVHVPFLMKQHQEKDHSKHSIRRYIMDILSYILTWSILDRRKILKICETKKLKNGGKYCLAFHPSPRHVDFQMMGGIRLKDLKTHTNSVGGAWGEDTWAAMVKDSCEAVLDTTEDNLEETQAKRALLIPLSVFTSTHIIKIATATGQTEDFKKYGVDEETPSGCEDPKNSTQRSGGSSYNLLLPDVSSIQSPQANDDEAEEINFDVLERPSSLDIMQESSDGAEFGADETHDGTEHGTDESSENTLTEETEDDDGMIFLDAHSPRTHRRAHLSKTLKASNRNITVVESGNDTFFVCPCGFSSTNRSGSSRHKCRSPNEGVTFACKECNKICKNAGSLKRHTISMHKNRQSVSLPANISSCILETVLGPQPVILSNEKNSLSSLPVTTTSATVPVSASPSPSPSSPTVPARAPSPTSKTCTICGKTFSSKSSVARHIKNVHGKVQIKYDLLNFHLYCFSLGQYFFNGSHMHQHTITRAFTSSRTFLGNFNSTTPPLFNHCSFQYL